MLDEQEQAELTALRERAWSARGRATPAEMDRLATLEQKRGQASPVSHSDATSDAEAPLSEDARADTSLPAQRPRRNRRRLVIMGGIGIGVLAVGALAGSIGSDSMREQSIPEFDWVQTNEDRIAIYEEGSDPNIGLEPTSIRLIASLDEVLLYLGHRQGTTEVCVAAVFSYSGGTASVSCGEKDVTTHLRDDMWVSVGNADASADGSVPAGLTSERLSASVILYTAP